MPDHRVLSKKDYDAGTSPGTLYYTSPISKLPRGGVSAVSYTAVCVGVAEGFLQNYIDFTAPRKSRGKAVAEEPGTQMLIGLASAEIVPPSIDRHCVIGDTPTRSCFTGDTQTRSLACTLPGSLALSFLYMA